MRRKGGRIFVGPADIERFRRQWPGSGMEDLQRLVVEVFRGDVVDLQITPAWLQYEINPDALAALVEDAMEFTPIRESLP